MRFPKLVETLYLIIKIANGTCEKLDVNIIITN